MQPNGLCFSPDYSLLYVADTGAGETKVWNVGGERLLGVRREGVTEADGKLRELGAIRYSRGKITVVDRPQMERLCCECYSVVKKEGGLVADLFAAEDRPRHRLGSRAGCLCGDVQTRRLQFPSI